MNKFSFDPAQYTECRPKYPDSLFEYLKSISGGDVVLDCEAGSGQATQSLANYFKYIIATDLSFELLSKTPVDNVYYIQSMAEQLPIRSSAVDLICIAQAIHWFLLEKFYDEVRRVLTPKWYDCCMGI